MNRDCDRLENSSIGSSGGKNRWSSIGLKSSNRVSSSSGYQILK